MTPQLALVGRPNVGKSTLFNKLTRARNALVADVPGLTRDRQYGRAVLGDKPCILIDTGGLDAEGQFADLVGRQAQAAIADASCVLFIVDAQGGLTVGDQVIADDLRRSGPPSCSSRQQDRRVGRCGRVGGVQPTGVC